MVSGWFSDEFELEYGRSEDGVLIFEVKFRDTGNAMQSFELGIAEFHARAWSPGDEIDFGEMPRRLAAALLDRGAVDMPFDAYVIGNGAPSTLDRTLADIAGIGGLRRYGVAAA
jgi:hypothetical protein